MDPTLYEYHHSMTVEYDGKCSNVFNAEIEKNLKTIAGNYDLNIYGMNGSGEFMASWEARLPVTGSIGDIPFIASWETDILSDLKSDINPPQDVPSMIANYKF